jgi:EAL domain-containing protein (putative c-di-GMP-specific phosphodiesterase class I)
MSRKNLERYQMENALRRAVEYNELVIHFQPKFSLHTGSISGAEALIRWHHPQFGLLLPDQFVSVAEDLGLIGELGLWTIREVCKCIQQWRGQGLRNVRIAVNVSYSQFADEEFCDKIDATLRSFELPPAILELELTETVLMQNADQLMYTLKKLKDMGIRISVDDFGTGYSSLAYLKRLPVDSVKIDRSFISDLPGDADDVAITHAVLALVHSLKRSVVAEGVETRDQLHFLLESGCDEVQGFYFSAALPSAEFKRYLNDTKYISLST